MLKKKRKEKVSQSLPVLRLSPLSIVGQIGMYRFKAKLRYGFLSTYDEGITLKQELNTNTGVYELWYLPVIRNNTQSQAVDIGQQTQPGSFHGMVSWRECLLLLGMKAQTGNWKCHNNMPASQFLQESHVRTWAIPGYSPIIAADSLGNGRPAFFHFIRETLHRNTLVDLTLILPLPQLLFMIFTSVS